jgi:hypothetical protein
MKKPLIIIIAFIVLLALTRTAKAPHIPTECEAFKHVEICGEQYIPVCGISTDEYITYANLCKACTSLEKDHIKEIRNGECQ